ncbi:LysR substrate-binding domain-containing protein [Actinomycetospora termitidis]|uniref:LysR substrate-binding domain-containing protein n=1 Tax=Actinomycetospora termitidis TaxID=3053470 RepID=A0ABT7M9D2_9PSEU|nr:LysR substrate-binding domain-containing protein [Actinomycetospora sp. Odt1-22]MDL5157283.1 LysR substrate-binding domain-containing protein [Actinomycetospora sp. Odt1-22]
MSSSNFTLRQVSYLVAVAEHGTLAAAAATLHVSPSAISVALDELERALGVQLTLRRRAHGVRLTPAGRAAVTRGRRLLRDAGELATSLGGASGVVSVGCYPTLAPVVLAPWIAAVHRRHPDTRVEFVEDDQDHLQRRLLDGELDLAVLYDHGLSADLETERVAANVPYLLVARDHPATDLHAVADEPMVLLDLPPSSDHALAVCRELGVTPRIEHRTRSTEMVRALVGLGLGWSVLAQAVPDHDVRVARVPLPAEPLPVVAAWSRAVTRSPVVQAMLDARP